MPGPTLTIVTPWFEHEELAADYFSTVIPCLTDDDRLCVVDNGSNPPLPFADIRLEHNEGVNFAYNVGLRTADTEAVLFLNKANCETVIGRFAVDDE